MLKWGSWLTGHVGVMLSFMLYQNTDLNAYIKAQKIRLDWWCYLLSRYCWMKSTMLSCLLTLGTKRCMLYCLLICGGHRCENSVREFAKSVRFVNMLKIAHKHPQVYWNPYLLPTDGLYLGQWTLLLGYLYVQMVITLFSPVLIVWLSTLFWLDVL